VARQLLNRPRRPSHRHARARGVAQRARLIPARGTSHHRPIAPTSRALWSRLRRTPRCGLTMFASAFSSSSRCSRYEHAWSRVFTTAVTYGVANVSNLDVQLGDAFHRTQRTSITPGVESRSVRGYRRRVPGRHARQQKWPARLFESASERLDAQVLTHAVQGDLWHPACSARDQHPPPPALGRDNTPIPPTGGARRPPDTSPR